MQSVRPFFADDLSLLPAWFLIVLVLEFVIQALLVTILAFVVISISRSALVQRLRIRRKAIRGIALGLPLFLMLLGTALVFPYYLVDLEWAQMIVVVAASWFGVTAFLVLTAWVGQLEAT